MGKTLLSAAKELQLMNICQLDLGLRQLLCFRCRNTARKCVCPSLQHALHTSSISTRPYLVFRGQDNC